jgi:hypothetical protein
MAFSFTDQNGWLSFCHPIFRFHAITICDILRMIGPPLGKPDLMGPKRAGG